MKKLLWMLTFSLAGCSLLLGDNFNDLEPRSDAGTGSSRLADNQTLRDASVRGKDAGACEDCDGAVDKPSRRDAGSAGAGGAAGAGGDSHAADGGQAGAASGEPADATVVSEDPGAGLCPDAPCAEHEHCVGSGTTQRCECDDAYVDFFIDGIETCVPDVCRDVQCGAGGECIISGEQEALCRCKMGFETVGGSAPCMVIDACAMDNMCIDTEYTCTSTVPYYYCQGRFAEWPMPEDYAGAKTQPKYEIGSDALDGTITDAVTHLMWQRQLLEDYPGCKGSGEPPAPGTEPVPNRCIWEDAKAYCDKLELAGFSDWRLPSKIELESLVSHSRAGPAQHEGFMGLGSYGDIWTSSSYSSDSSQAWMVNTFSGTSLKQSKSAFAAYARCVRTERQPTGLPPERHFVGGHDNRTGLIWQLNPPTDRFTHAQAVDYCDQYTQNGMADWRLPSVKEYLTIVDPTRHDPAIINTLDAPEVADDFWARDGSAVPHSGTSYWYVSFKDGSAANCCYNEQGERSLLVRCVR